MLCCPWSFCFYRFLPRETSGLPHLPRSILDWSIISGRIDKVNLANFPKIYNVFPSKISKTVLSVRIALQASAYNFWEGGQLLIVDKLPIVTNSNWSNSSYVIPIHWFHLNSLCWKCAAAYPLLTQNYPFLCLETGLVMITMMMVTMTAMRLMFTVILTRGRGREAAVRERGGVIYKSEQVAQ